MEKGALETRNPRGHPDDRTVATQRGQFPACQVSLKYGLILVMMSCLSWQRQCMDFLEAVSNPSPNVRYWLLADIQRMPTQTCTPQRIVAKIVLPRHFCYYCWQLAGAIWRISVCRVPCDYGPGG